MFYFRIASLTSSAKDVINIEKNSLTLLVGPNSSGKSTALVNIDRALANPSEKSLLVFEKSEFQKSDNSQEAIQWISSNFPKATVSGMSVYRTVGGEIQENQILETWKNNAAGLHQFLLHRLDTKQRLLTADPTPRGNRDSAPANYIQVVQRNDDTLKALSKEVKRTFEKDVVVNHGGERTVWFHVGLEPKRTKEHDRISDLYLAALSNVPTLAEEGDGIKSYIACLLGVYCGAQKILLVDEPEAFLHPQQARRLGNILASSAKSTKRQVIAATHSPDIVVGALSSNAPVSVCRIDRVGETNKAYLLDSSQLKKLWSKPLLQSTGAINGIFHKGVVVCEADADCRFFEALLRRLEEKKILAATPDLYFIHGGGKGEIPTLIGAYRALSIPAAAIADFDLLQSEAEFKKVVQVFNAGFDQIEKRYRSARQALDELPPTMGADVVADKLRKHANTIQEKASVTVDIKKAVSGLLTDSAKWSEAKKYGISKLKGGKYTDCKDTLDHCANNGIFVIENGELESWWREGPSDKLEWILKAITRVQKDQGSFVEAEKFLINICKFFGYKVK